MAQQASVPWVGNNRCWIVAASLCTTADYSWVPFRTWCSILLIATLTPQPNGVCCCRVIFWGGETTEYPAHRALHDSSEYRLQRVMEEYFQSEPADLVQDHNPPAPSAVVAGGASIAAENQGLAAAGAEASERGARSHFRNVDDFGLGDVLGCDNGYR